MRFEKILFLQVRAAKNDSRVQFAEDCQSRVPEVEQARDKEGVYIRPRQTLTLVEKLMVRAGAMPAPAAAPAAAPRGRGRPRKGGDPKS